MTDLQFNEMLDGLVRSTFRDALRASVRDPRLAGFFLRTLKTQKRAAALRAAWEEKGVHVPPFMILSVTDRCNLHCVGCTVCVKACSFNKKGYAGIEKAFDVRHSGDRASP